MHYLALVVIQPSGDVEDLVRSAMAPFRKRWAEEDGHTVGEWEWYRIGGVWTGCLDGYNPREDPGNFARCWVCNGTGKRDDEFGREQRRIYKTYSCNGCQGKGESIKSTYDWKRHDGDVMTIDALDVDTVSSRVLLVDGKWHAPTDYWSDDAREQSIVVVRSLLADHKKTNPMDRVVVVDCCY